MEIYQTQLKILVQVKNRHLVILICMLLQLIFLILTYLRFIRDLSNNKLNGSIPFELPNIRNTLQYGTLYM